MFGGHWEILIIAGVILLLFGSTRLPGLMRSIGASANAFKEGLREGDKPDADAIESKDVE